MIAMVAIIVAAIFSLMLGDWIIGVGMGVAFAAGLYFAVIFQARQAPRKRRRR
jgi:type IV secretory pathway TrbD component